MIALARPRPWSLLGGLALGLLGEALRIWASGHIEKTRVLATGGPYAHTRNPLYMGSTLMAAGIALASASPWAALAGAVYFFAFYPSAIRDEARFLATRFPDTFAPWAREVPAFGRQHERRLLALNREVERELDVRCLCVAGRSKDGERQGGGAGANQ